MTIQMRNTLLGLWVFLGALLFNQPELHAQYLGLNLRGDVGVKSGSQPGPGMYLIAPLYYRSDYTGIRNREWRRNSFGD